MTTIKEYKAIMEGATDAPWSYEQQEFMPERVWKGTKQICHVIGDTSETQSNASFIAASRNIAPELIRVIELAEEALTQCDDAMHYMSEYDIPIMLPDNVKQALSEIRKLKGE